MITTKSLCCIVLLVASVAALGQTVVDYQAAIREATEAYRGDCTELSGVVVRRELFVGSIDRMFQSPGVCVFGCGFFPHERLRLDHSEQLNPASQPFGLQRFTPNQAMQLTATARSFETPFDD